MTAEDLMYDFQTPPEVCDLMVSLLPADAIKVLEPTPGQGNIVKALNGRQVVAPVDFFQMQCDKFDAVIMNPPFSRQYTIGLPKEYDKKGFQVGYHILKECMKMSDNIVALLPWFVITNSYKRMTEIKSWGLKTVYIIPRSLFPGSRASNCILVLEKGYSDTIELKTY